MRNTIFINGVNLLERDLEMLEEINKCLFTYGLYISQHKSDVPGEERTCIAIDFDKEKYLEKNSRQAGARRRFTGEKINVADLEAEIAASSPDAVAKKFGISRATLYRRIKESKETDNVVLM